MNDLAEKLQREYYREYRQKNRERINAYNRQWRKENPEKTKEYQERYWKKKAEQLRGEC